MGLVVDENYNERTMLGNYYPIIRQNIRNIADFINEQQSRIEELDNSVTDINDNVLPKKSEEIEANRADIGRITRFADVIIQPEADGINESIIFQNPIPGLKYSVFDGDVALTDTVIEMTGTITGRAGIFETEGLKIKFYAEDGCEIAEASLKVINIAGIKTAFLESQIVCEEEENE